MNNANPRMNPIPLTHHSINPHLIRSKSPQFDPIMNGRLSLNQFSLSPNIYQKSNPDLNAQRPDKRLDQLNQDMEIKTDVIVSFRNTSDANRPKNGTNQLNEYKPNNTLPLNTTESAKQDVFGNALANNSEKQDLKIPIKSETSKSSLETFLKRQTYTRNKNQTSQIANSDIMGVKIRSPSVITTEKPSFLTSEIATPKMKDSSKVALDLPLTKMSKLKNIQPVLCVDPQKTLLVQKQNDASVNNNQTQNQTVSIENPQKRSLSEKIQFGQGRNRPDLLLDNPKALIRLLTNQARFLPEFDKPRVITKNYKVVHSFAVTTHKGIVRNYNEDRVSVLLNVQQNLQKEGMADTSESYSLFSIFDGHGGYGCCNFLKDHLHNKLLETCDFNNPSSSNLGNVYKSLDYQYIKSAVDGNHKFSGSCAVTIVLGPKFGLAINVGDSRVFCSKKHGSLVQDITTDHKPESTTEFARIIKNNGQLYRMSANQRTGEERYYFIKQFNELEQINKIEENNPHIIFGPWRVKPGGLSVSRSFGDVESKMQSLGGVAGTVICEPETSSFSYEDIDFIVIGCDGVFDKLSSEKISETVWETINYYKERYLEDNSTYELILGECVNNILRRCMLSRSEDNLTAILLCFKNLYA